LPFSLVKHGAYLTPLGEIPIESSVAEHLQALCPFLETDPSLQIGEHATEVLLPFLQYLGPEAISIVPIILQGMDRQRLALLADGLAAVVNRAPEPILLIASSDLSAYLPESSSRQQDQAIIQTIAGVNGNRLLNHLQEHQLQMCGDTALACVLDAARKLGARQVKVTGYANSADFGGDPDSSIGYAGAVIT